MGSLSLLGLGGDLHPEKRSVPKRGSYLSKKKILRARESACRSQILFLKEQNTAGEALLTICLRKRARVHDYKRLGGGPATEARLMVGEKEKRNAAHSTKSQRLV